MHLFSGVLGSGSRRRRQFWISWRLKRAATGGRQTAPIYWRRVSTLLPDRGRCKFWRIIGMSEPHERPQTKTGDGVEEIVLDKEEEEALERAWEKRSAKH